METLKQLETLFEEKGLESLLPQNLPEPLLNEVCNLFDEFQNFTFDNESKAYRDMQEIINPALERPYTDITRFLIQSFCRVNENELEETLKVISGKVNMFLTMAAHYYLEQVRRAGGLDVEPLPTVNNILNENKSSKKFKVRRDYLEECAGLHFLCFKDDIKKIR